MLERKEKAGFTGKKWRAFLVWHIGLLHCSTRKLPLTIRHLNLMVHVQETIELAHPQLGNLQPELFTERIDLCLLPR